MKCSCEEGTVGDAIYVVKRTIVVVGKTVGLPNHGFFGEVGKKEEIGFKIRKRRGGGF